MLSTGQIAGNTESRKRVLASLARRTGNNTIIHHQYHGLAVHSTSPYLVELVAEINGVDVVAFQIREHDNLG